MYSKKELTKMVQKMKSDSEIIQSDKKTKKSSKKKGPKQSYKNVKEENKELRESLKLKNQPIKEAFESNYEEFLKAKLFEVENKIADEIEAIKNEDLIYKEDIPEVKRDRSGLWDYVIEDEIKFFDPECSYELTGYRPITMEKGLDFDPEPFCEAGMVYDRTGSYCEYPKGSKPYADFWIEQLRRCTEGYIVNGYRITPDHYFFLNFYRMNIVNEGNKTATGDTEGFPKFLVEQYKFFHYFEMCEYLKKDVVALKSRGIEQCATI